MYTQSLLQEIETIDKKEGEGDLSMEDLACKDSLKVNWQTYYKWRRRLGDRNQEFGR